MATDLNQAMLDEAVAVGTGRPVEWRQADAMQLPFPDQTFDAVVCQFGVMFFPDKSKAFAEALRVLSAGGLFIFNVWDRIEENGFADTVTIALASVFPTDPPRFLARTPHGYHDLAIIEEDQPRAASRSRRGSRQSRPRAEPRLRECRQLHTATGRLCGTRSKLATRTGSTKQRTRPPRLSPAGLGPRR